MKWGRIIAACAAVILIGIGVWFLFFHVRHTDAPLPNEAMVLRLTWTDGTRTALSDHAPLFGGITVLASQIFPDGAVQWSDADNSLLARLHAPVELTVQLMAPIDLDPGSPQFRAIASAIKASLAAAQAAGVNPTGILLDPQGAHPSIQGFSSALATARDAGHLPVSFIAPRDWLDEPEFKSLAKSAGSFVLRENSPNAAETALCDPTEIQKDAERAAGFRVPFRVELPTYAANFSSDPPVILRPDPLDTVALLAAWRKSHPVLLTAVLWHRLPQEDDVNTWRWVTLESVLDGTAPQADVRAEARHVDPNDPTLTEISLVNKGGADARIDADYLVEWDETGDMQHCDTLPGYTPHITGRYKLLFQHDPAALQYQRLSPGDRRAIGTVKLSNDTPVHVSVAP